MKYKPAMNLYASLRPLALAAGLGLAAWGGGSAGGTDSAPGANPRAPIGAPALPRASLTAADLALLIKDGDPVSEAIGLAYQRARGIPDAQVIHLPVSSDGEVISAADFTALKTTLDARLPDSVQATLVTWMRPSRVQGPCSMGLTSALVFGQAGRRDNRR